MTMVLDGTSGITTNSGTVVSTTDATINGLTVGKGGGSVSTNTAVGASALNANTTAANNTAVGYEAGIANTTGRITAFGHRVLYSNTTGTGNVGVGGNDGSVASALLSNTTGSSNTGIGVGALLSNTTASNNTAVGYQSLYSSTGIENTAIGSGSGYSNTTGVNNCFLGRIAGYFVTTGSYNTCVGDNSGSYSTNLVTGSNNTYIGYRATPSSSSVSGEIVLSSVATFGKGSNTGYINPNGGGVYQGSNSSSWLTTSDQRLKKNIVDNTDGLNKITAVRVRNFEYRLPEEVTELDKTCAVSNTGVQLGVIAQELQAVLPDCVKEESTGVLSVDPDNLTWYMVNAIKDLKAIVDAQAVEIAELKGKA